MRKVFQRQPTSEWRIKTSSGFRVLRGIARSVMGEKLSAFRLAWIGMCLFLCLSIGRAVTAEPLSAGMPLPQFLVSAADPEEARPYLGLEKVHDFSLSQIPAELIFVPVFSVLCLDCQKQAPDLNKIYQLIQQDEELSKNIKMIGVGVKSDRKQLLAYKATFHVRFPLLFDPQNEIFDKLGEPAIPFLMLVNRCGKVLLTHHGPFKNVEEFFFRIKKEYEQR
ncbi:MAG: TlpA family protein disulfide reductase [Deltaproteobacteria bacterium]|nr:TlpA family protein disulfide reductase [Deltaproteobacteria bacterium]